MLGLVIRPSGRLLIRGGHGSQHLARSAGLASQPAYSGSVEPTVRIQRGEGILNQASYSLVPKHRRRLRALIAKFAK